MHHTRSRKIFVEYLLIILVREIDSTWNPVQSSVLVMYKKLIDLGFTYYDGKIVIIEPP